MNKELHSTCSKCAKAVCHPLIKTDETPSFDNAPNARIGWMERYFKDGDSPEDIVISNNWKRLHE